MAKVDQTSSCWRWKGYVQPNGYAMFSYRGRPELAHRVSYELFIGPIPAGKTIDHVKERGCRFKDCTRPDHLEAVTLAENRRRGNPSNQWAGATHCINGHLFDEPNTYRAPGSPGQRRCRQCRTDRDKRRRRSPTNSKENPHRW